MMEACAYMLAELVGDTIEVQGIFCTRERAVQHCRERRRYEIVPMVLDVDYHDVTDFDTVKVGW